MADIEITLPTVQYGNIKITASPEEWGLDSIADAPDVGVWAATYLNLFQQGFKHGAAMDVDAHLGAPPKDPRDAVGDPTAAAVAAIQDGLGATVEDEYDSATEAKEAAQERTSDKPWDKPAEASPKPWETSVTAPAVLDAIGEGW